MSTTIVNKTYRNLYYLQQPEIEVIATITNNKQLNLFCRSMYDSSIKFRETVFALFFVGFDCIGVFQAGSGHKYETCIDFDSIARVALLVGCEGVILCHNHPSGDTSESKSDQRVISLLSKKLKVLGIGLAGSIILSGTDNKYKCYE